ncbi:MAG: hypothetical protein AB1512_09675 [Thermodesulfobacteriota bacterium]
MQEQQAAQEVPAREGTVGKYIRWIVISLGAAVIAATFVMAIYRKFGG